MECVQYAELTNHREEAGKPVSALHTDLLSEEGGGGRGEREHQKAKEEEVVAHGQPTLCFLNDRKEMKWNP